MRGKPFDIEWIAGPADILHDIGQILLDEMGQQPPIRDMAAPADGLFFVGFIPEFRDEAAQQQLLDEAHARMRRHFERAKFE